LDTPSYDIRGVSSGSCRNVVVEKVPDVSEDQAYCLHAQGRNSERSKSASRWASYRVQNNLFCKADYA